MNARSQAVVATTKVVVTTARDKEITFLAAAVAYYAFASLLPALLLLLVVATTLGGASFADRLVTLTGGFLTPAGQETITAAIANAPGAGGATVIGIALLAWSTLKVFRALDTAFLTVYGQTDTASLGAQFRDAILVVLGISGGMVVMIVLAVALAALPLGPIGWLVGIFSLPGVLALALLPVYRQFPNPPIPVRQALPGTIFAAVGWTLLQAGFQLYAASATQYAAYGVIGGILLLVTWLYLAANIVIFGAIINAVLAEVEGVETPP